jgi:hypothetical protein
LPTSIAPKDLADTLMFMSKINRYVGTAIYNLIAAFKENPSMAAVDDWLGATNAQAVPPAHRPAIEAYAAYLLKRLSNTK